VTIEESTADTAVEDPFEREVVRLGLPGGDEIVTLDHTLDSEAFVVCGTATEATTVGRVGVLKAVFHAE